MATRLFSKSLALIRAEPLDFFGYSEGRERTLIVYSIATRLGHVDAVSCFLKHGADITGKTTMGDTPLRIAAEMAYPAVVKLLLEKGAPTDIFDNNGFDFIRWSQGRRRLIAEASAGGLTEEEKSNLLEVCDYLENPPLAEGPSLDGHSRKYYPQNEASCQTTPLACFSC